MRVCSSMNVWKRGHFVLKMTTLFVLKSKCVAVVDRFKADFKKSHFANLLCDTFMTLWMEFESMLGRNSFPITLFWWHSYCEYLMVIIVCLYALQIFSTMVNKPIAIDENSSTHSHTIIRTHAHTKTNMTSKHFDKRGAGAMQFCLTNWSRSSRSFVGTWVWSKWTLLSRLLISPGTTSSTMTSSVNSWTTGDQAN